MAISKIILNGVTQMDVTQDTVTTSTLMSGETAHDASGTQITGTASGGGGDYSLVRCYVKGGNSYTYARVVGASSSTGLVSVKQIPSSSGYTEIYVPRRDANTGILIASGAASYYWARMSEGTGATVISSSSETTNIAVEDDAYVIISVTIKD